MSEKESVFVPSQHIPAKDIDATYDALHKALEDTLGKMNLIQQENNRLKGALGVEAIDLLEGHVVAELASNERNAILHKERDQAIKDHIRCCETNNENANKRMVAEAEVKRYREALEKISSDDPNTLLEYFEVGDQMLSLVRIYEDIAAQALKGEE